MNTRIKQRQHGFTLMELMIAIVIIGILAAVAYPGYQNQIRRARRADAQGDLMAFAAAMERNFSATSTYLGLAAGGNPTGVPALTTFPPTSPTAGGGPVAYNLTIQAATATTYTLRAVPIGPQAVDGMLELTSAGVRRWDRNNDAVFANPGEITWDQ